MGLVTARHLTTLALLLTAAAAGAQPTAWTRLEGPRAAGLRIAAVGSDGTLLAGTYVDVLRNGGSGWTQVAGAVNGSIHDIAMAPGGRVWAGTSGALRSDDNGLTWQWFSIRTAPHSGTHPTVMHVAQSPSGVVFAGGYRTTDAGASWPQMSIYAGSTAFVGSTTYAGTFDGVHRSTDGGASWIPSGLQGFGVAHMAATGTRLVAATDFGILISDDGQSWMATCTLPQVGGLAVAGDGSVWAAAPSGLYRSPDGQSWPFEPTAFAGQMVEDIAANGSQLLAIVEGNPHRSTDGGSTWLAVHEGLGMPFASAAGAGGGVLAVAAGGAGPFRSVDGGESWTRWTAGLPSQTVRRLIFDAGAGLAFAEGFTGLYRAALDGGPWELISLSDGSDAAGLAHDGTVLIAVADGSAMDHRIYRSVDAGATWILAHTEPDAFGPHIAAGGGVAVVSAVGFAGPPRLLVSDDHGVTWTTRPHPTSPSFGFSPPLFVDGAGRIYVEDGNQLQRSADMGVTWTPLGTAGSADNRVASLHADADALCLGTSEGVWCSENDGATFVSVGTGLPAGGAASIVGLVRDGERYAALTASDGVFVSDATTAGEPPAPAGAFALSMAPNPSTASAVVTVSMAQDDVVTIAVFDALGRRVAALHDGPLAGGTHRIPFAAAGLTPGVYVLRASGTAGRAMTRLVVR